MPQAIEEFRYARQHIHMESTSFVGIGQQYHHRRRRSILHGIKVWVEDTLRCLGAVNRDHECRVQQDKFTQQARYSRMFLH